MADRQPIKRAQSCAIDPPRAVQELHAALTQPDPSLVVFFCSSDYDLDALALEMDRAFAGVPVVGCTTAGEIGPAGYCEHSLAGASFPNETCIAVTGLLDHLQEFTLARGQTFVQGLLERLRSQSAKADAHNSFAFLLIDGMSRREEQVTRGIQHALGKLQMFGGSAGDGLNFSATHVYHEDRFHDDSAVLILVTTSLPFRIFKTQHFVSGDERLVVTAADTMRRIVHEINGLPAAEEYARLIGADIRNLDPMHFAASPVVVVIDGTDYVRSIQKANPDGSLTFYCAIEEGLVLRVAHGTDLIGNLERAMEGLRAEIGPPQVIFGCDCILRNLEITQKGLKNRVQQIFRDNNTLGFSTYGEQINGVHVNQTLTGIAIGASPELSDG